MLRVLGRRIVQALAFIGLSTALVVAGCEASIEPPSLDAELEWRAGEDGPSAWIVAEGDEIAEAIVADPAFDELVGVAAEIMGDIRDAQQALPGEEVDAIARTINEPWFAETMAPGTLLEHLGGEAENLQQMRTILDGLRTKHGLAEASPEDVGYVFELAIATDEAQQILTAAVADEIDTGSDWNQCTAACYAIYMYGFVIALGVFIIAMAIAVVIFPWGLVLAAIAIAMFTRTVAQLEAALAACLAKCGVVDDDDDRDLCGEWEVCEDHEYCWKGVLGIGKDHCRPKKDESQVCSTHEACWSGCCKYHFLSHPVSKVCRPASACG